MTLPIILLLIILIIALVLFSFEWVPPDVTALGILVVLIVTGLVPLDQAFDGFGSDTVMLLIGLLIMTAALIRNGVVEVVGRLRDKRFTPFGTFRPRIQNPEVRCTLFFG